MENIIDRRDVQELVRKGKIKDMRLWATVNHNNFLVISCDRDYLEIGIVATDFDVAELNQRLQAL